MHYASELTAEQQLVEDSSHIFYLSYAKATAPTNLLVEDSSHIFHLSYAKASTYTQLTPSNGQQAGWPDSLMT